METSNQTLAEDKRHRKDNELMQVEDPVDVAKSAGSKKKRKKKGQKNIMHEENTGASVEKSRTPSQDHLRLLAAGSCTDGHTSSEQLGTPSSSVPSTPQHVQDAEGADISPAKKDRRKGRYAKKKATAQESAFQSAGTGQAGYVPQSYNDVENYKRWSSPKPFPKGPMNIPAGVQPMNYIKSPPVANKEAPKQEKFLPYWGSQEVEKGLTSGTLIKGFIRINPRNYQRAYISQDWEKKERTCMYYLPQKCFVVYEQCKYGNLDENIEMKKMHFMPNFSAIGLKPGMAFCNFLTLVLRGLVRPEKKHLKPMHHTKTIIDSQEEGHLSEDGEDDKDVLIEGVIDRNRALEGDEVAIKLHDESKWQIEEGANGENMIQKTGMVVSILQKHHNRCTVGYLKLVPQTAKSNTSRKKSTTPGKNTPPSPCLKVMSTKIQGSPQSLGGKSIHNHLKEDIQASSPPCVVPHDVAQSSPALESFTQHKDNLVILVKQITEVEVQPGVLKEMPNAPASCENPVFSSGTPSIQTSEPSRPPHSETQIQMQPSAGNMNLGESKKSKSISIKPEKNSPETSSQPSESQVMPFKMPEKVLFSPRDARMPRMWVKTSNLPSGTPLDLDPTNCQNHLFLASITEWNEQPIACGALLAYVGEADEVESETVALLLEHNLDVTPYPPNLLRLPPLPFQIPQKELEERRDLRHLCVFTIDPPTAKDLDDALSVRKLDDHHLEIGVHIADPSFFLEEGSDLDLFVRSRATSIYLVQQVYHMLPKDLCMLCSLLPGEDKLAFSIIMEVHTETWTVTSHQFFRSIVNSCAQLAYDHAQAFLDSPDSEWSSENFPKVHNGYTIKDLCQAVNLIRPYTAVLRERRFAFSGEEIEDDETDFKGGALRINQPKLCFKLNDATCMPQEVFVYENKESHRMIEELMLMANILTAQRLYSVYPNHAFLRRHSKPKVRMLNNLAEELTHYGIHLATHSAGALHASLRQYSKGFWENDSSATEDCRGMNCHTKDNFSHCQPGGGKEILKLEETSKFSGTCHMASSNQIALVKISILADVSMLDSVIVFSAVESEDDAQVEHGNVGQNGDLNAVENLRGISTEEDSLYDKTNKGEELHLPKPLEPGTLESVGNLTESGSAVENLEADLGNLELGNDVNQKEGKASDEFGKEKTQVVSDEENVFKGPILKGRRGHQGCDEKKKFPFKREEAVKNKLVQVASDKKIFASLPSRISLSERELAEARDLVLNHLCAKPMVRADYYCLGASVEKTANKDMKWKLDGQDGENTEVYTHHYALNVPLYTHFTSPIRRYADIMVHRLLAASLGYAPPPTADPLEIQKIATNCNVQNYGAKRASETSNELFFRLWIRLQVEQDKKNGMSSIQKSLGNQVVGDLEESQSEGGLRETAVVVNAKDYSFDAMLLRFGVLVRVYVNKLPASVRSYKKHGTNTISLLWFLPGKVAATKASPRQDIAMFSIVDLIIRYSYSARRIRAELVSPVAGPNGTK